MRHLSNNRRLLTIGLSVDFDFFIREEVMWDWGHSEDRGGLDEVIWRIRYESRHIDVMKETDIETFADTTPERLTMALMRKGLSFADGAPTRRFGVADSHRYAYQFFKSMMPRPDVIINIDAHHDCWADTGGPVDCDSWVTRLRYDWPATNFLQLYPKWKDEREDGPPQRRVDKLASVDPDNWQSKKFRDWQGFDRPTLLGDIFLCRSGAWVPPHHDARFLALSQSLAAWGKFTQLEPITKRMTITQEDVAGWRAHAAEIDRKLTEDRINDAR